jgi:hypothetical protein
MILHCVVQPKRVSVYHTILSYNIWDQRAMRPRQDVLTDLVVERNIKVVERFVQVGSQQYAGRCLIHLTNRLFVS